MKRWVEEDYLQRFDDIAGAEDEVGCRELEGLRRRKVRGEDALLGAAAAENLTGGAGAVVIVSSLLRSLGFSGRREGGRRGRGGGREVLRVEACFHVVN